MSVDHPIHYVLHRRHGTRTLVHGVVPGVTDTVPQHGGEQERRRNGFVLVQTTIGLRERELQEALALRLGRDFVQNRQNPALQSLFAQFAYTRDGVARQQQFESLLEQS